MLDKKFHPAKAEKRIYRQWEEAGAFRPRPDRIKKGAQPYCIVIPPPNVTGTLHMGHALNNTIQDILVRFERMRGRDVLWQPGTDHAGIATQMVVERQLAEKGEPGRRELGREEFVNRIWEWKEHSGGAIINQLKRLGASCDWSRERFTMDEGLSRAVIKVFIELYRAGLIYRGQRLVNWDPKFHTAISDLEVENIEVDGHMWHFKYPLEGGLTYTYVERDEDGRVVLEEERDYISIATTRPETMLGDGAVAVHPSDERYAPIIGKLCEIPVGPKELRRHIPIITDDYPDPDFGSGAVKITGAHDFNDYAVARRHNIPLYRLMDEEANMRSDGLSYEESAGLAAKLAEGSISPEDVDVDAINLVPEHLRGLDRYEAREKVIDEITNDGLAVMTVGEDGEPEPLVENKKIMQPFGDRSHVVIEPMLTDQWFVNAEKLAGPAIEAVESGDTRFVPANWENTYFQWMRNIEPWCISRQLWWGHRIPAWFGPDGEIFVAHDEEEARELARKHYGRDEELKRDPDVLDTWFSSALWAFSTLGWPDDTPELKRYYPTSVLVTGFDIIFFWIARMMMMGLHFMKEVPFHTVYVHALVRDESGAKMSKSKGNVIDPLDIVDGINLEELVKKRTSSMMNPQDAKKIEKATRRAYPNGIPSYGTDALRFTLAAMAAQGRDVRMSLSRVEGYRNFATKLWNAARFTQMNECVRVEDFDPAGCKLVVNRWIFGELQRAANAITLGIETHRYNEAASEVYNFVWHVYCDWYLELVKTVLNDGEKEAQIETRAVAAFVLDDILKLLHPFMPFVSEELWQKLAEHGPARKTMLVLARWPELDGLENEEADREIDWLIRLITEIRSVRSEMNVPAGARISLVFSGADKQIEKRVDDNEDILRRLARLDRMTFENNVPDGAIQIILDGVTIAIPLEGIVDVAAETARLSREIDKNTAEIKKIDSKLQNEKFVSRAPVEIVEEQRRRRHEAKQAVDKLQLALKRIRSIAV